MKRERYIALLVLTCWASALMAQGVRVWNHGKYMEYKGESVDSLVFFEEEEPDGEEQGNVLNGHAWMDLGLPSGTLWATTNLGAAEPEDAGDYFAWGEVEAKTSFTSATYAYEQNAEGLTKYVPKRQCMFGYSKFYDDLTCLDTSDDAARMAWGEGWGIPTYAQMKELIACCTWEWTQEGMHGYRVFGPNGQSIFIPAAGCYSASRQIGVGKDAYLWLSDLYTPVPTQAYSLFFNEKAHYLSMFARNGGQPIRPVRVGER